MKNIFSTVTLDFKGYKALLYSLIIVLLVFPALQGFIYVNTVIGLALIGVLLIAVRAVASLRSHILLSGVLGATGIIGYFGDLFGFGAWFEVAALLGFGLFFLVVGIIIMTNIMLHIRRVKAELIYGSINVYLLVGLSFAFMHALVDFLQPGSISGLESLSMGTHTILPYVYYSFVTMTTLGFGDISPVTGPAATLAYVEAIFGQLYIAIMIARLVGLYIAHESNQGEQ